MEACPVLQNERWPSEAVESTRTCIHCSSVDGAIRLSGNARALNEDYIRAALCEGVWFSDGLAAFVFDGELPEDADIRIESEAGIVFALALSGESPAPSSAGARARTERRLRTFLSLNRAGAEPLRHAAARGYYRAFMVFCPLSFVTEGLDLETQHLSGHGNTEVIASARQWTVANDILTCNYRGAPRRMFIKAKLLEFVSAVAHDLKDSERQSTVPRLCRQDVERLHRAHELLARQYADPPQIAKLARALGLNRTKLRIGFRSLFSTTISDFCRQRRMEVARELVSSGLPLSRVAEQVGYEHQSSFTNAFTAFHGFPPKHLRDPRMWTYGHSHRRRDLDRLQRRL